MTFRTKSKLYGKWAFVRYLGDGAVYHVCQNCTYSYWGGYSSWQKPVPEKPVYHKYCPNCGLKMSLYNGNHVYLFDEDGNEVIK